jgi:DNA-binding PucR family transcriptional regulator
MLVDRIYVPLRDHPSALLATLEAYLANGRVLEATARGLFLHPNTVRYRLGRAAELVGLDPLTPRDAWVLQVALALGRMGHQGRTWRGR